MEIKKQTVKEAGSCNLCERSTLSENGLGLTYPYKYVYCITGRSVLFRMCKDCLREFVEKASVINE